MRPLPIAALLLTPLLHGEERTVAIHGDWSLLAIDGDEGPVHVGQTDVEVRHDAEDREGNRRATIPLRMGCSGRPALERFVLLDVDVAFASYRVDWRTGNKPPLVLRSEGMEVFDEFDAQDVSAQASEGGFALIRLRDPRGSLVREDEGWPKLYIVKLDGFKETRADLLASCEGERGPEEAADES